MLCDKHGYPTRKAAKDFIKYWNKKNPDKKLTYAYHCETCDCYHTTKAKKSVRHQITNRVRNLKDKK